jgi:hypothetical protein
VLAAAIRSVEPVLVIVDPITAYLRHPADDGPQPSAGDAGGSPTNGGRPRRIAPLAASRRGAR